ncbi:metallopeptidase family protein [Aureimonas fodinaquatilis]|uniref:Metallopeptidase family protein n=1 Tax=Aureimonas fodinaquatilis TaxID=2565783 RepID=A0A5B0DUX7_9HYPH|nr:metallopeptidase family protein [Aureimonas fodinaquatilis]KAA0969390.1 metallopeptidase family protein [Aureimonas fodinaquatilis]
MGKLDRSSDWAHCMAPSLEEIEQIAIVAYAALPVEFRSLCGDIQLHVADFPDEEIADEMGLETPYDILGLFEGSAIAEASAPATGQLPNRILLYRRPILDYWAEHEETLGALVSHVLIHEIGHHFGLSDDDMEALEDAAD